MTTVVYPRLANFAFLALLMSLYVASCERSPRQHREEPTRAASIEVAPIKISAMWDVFARRIEIGVEDDSKRHSQLKARLLATKPPDPPTEISSHVLGFITDKTDKPVHIPIGLYIQVGQSDTASPVSGGEEMFQVTAPGEYLMTFEVSESPGNTGWTPAKEFRFRCHDPNGEDAAVVFKF